MIHSVNRYLIMRRNKILKTPTFQRHSRIRVYVTIYRVIYEVVYGVGRPQRNDKDSVSTRIRRILIKLLICRHHESTPIHAALEAGLGSSQERKKYSI